MKYFYLGVINLIAFLAIVLIDCVIPGNETPILCAFYLAIVSIFASFEVVLFTAAMSFPLVCVGLLQDPADSFATSDGTNRFIIRAVTWIILFSLFIISAYYKRILKNSIKELKEILDNMPVAVCLVDENGIIDFANQSAAKLFGNFNLKGENIMMVLPDDGLTLDFHALSSGLLTEDELIKFYPDYELNITNVTFMRKTTLMITIRKRINLPNPS